VSICEYCAILTRKEWFCWKI